MYSFYKKLSECRLYSGAFIHTYIHIYVSNIQYVKPRWFYTEEWMNELLQHRANPPFFFTLICWPVGNWGPAFIWGIVGQSQRCPVSWETLTSPWLHTDSERKLHMWLMCLFCPVTWHRLWGKKKNPKDNLLPPVDSPVRMKHQIHKSRR